MVGGRLQRCLPFAPMHGEALLRPYCKLRGGFSWLITMSLSSGPAAGGSPLPPCWQGRGARPWYWSRRRASAAAVRPSSRDGYHFDVGASVVEVIQPIVQAFSALGTSYEKELDLIPCDPVMSTILPDGRRVTFPNSVEGTGEVIASISPEDGRRWFDFVDYMRELVEVSLNTFFVLPAVDLNDMLVMMQKDPRLAKALPAFLNSYQGVLQKFFKDETVLRTMGYQSLYFGLPPHWYRVPTP